MELTSKAFTFAFNTNEVYTPMKKTISGCILMLLCIITPSVHAQKTIDVTFERGNKGEYVFYAENQFKCPQTLEVTFSKLENASGPVSGGIPYQTVVHGSKQCIFTLNPANPDVPIDFRYTYTYVKGNIRAKTDTNFVYLLPVGEMKEVQINRMVSLEKVLGMNKSTQTTGLTFSMEEGDTVYACRSGLVAETQTNSASTGDHKSYARTENYVEIYHKDGTFALYKLFKNNGIFVEPGETVTAGQPIGIIGGSNYERGSHLRFITYYLAKEDSSEDHYGQAVSVFKSTVFVPPFHLASDNDEKPDYNKTYRAEHPQAYIMKEMTKAQKKKLLKTQSKQLLK